MLAFLCWRAAGVACLEAFTYSTDPGIFLGHCIVATAGALSYWWLDLLAILTHACKEGYYVNIDTRTPTASRHSSLTTTVGFGTQRAKTSKIEKTNFFFLLGGHWMNLIASSLVRSLFNKELLQASGLNSFPSNWW
jgi:hypothetical protein